MTSRPSREPPDSHAVSWKHAFWIAGLLLAVGVVPQGTAALPAGEDSTRLVSPEWVGNQWVMYESEARVQENIGERILAIERFDSERLTTLAQLWREVSEDALNFAAGRSARLQEALGHSIATTARALYNEETSLRSALADARDQQQRIRTGAWFQERLGAVIVQTAGAVPPNTPSFPEQLLSRIRVLSELERRTASNTDALVASLSARYAQLPRDAISRLADAVADGHRVSRFYDASVEANLGRAMNEIQHEMARTRSPGDYQELVQAARATVNPPWRAGGFLEFGAAALLGAIAVMVWVALTTRGDFPRGRGRTITPTAARSFPLIPWKARVAKPRTITLSIWPREVTFGGHCVREIGRHAARGNARHVAIVTDQGVAAKGLVDPVKASLSGAGVQCDVFDLVSREVPHDVIAQIAARCRQAGTDLLVAVGGGSVIDTAKAVGIVLTNGGSILDYDGVDRVRHPIMSLYAVPTTAGSGAETSPFCIVRDATQGRKIEIFSAKLIPERVFIDPLMTRSMPPELTAGTGMEALANAIEAYCSTWANPLSDTLALDAMRLIAENLRATVANGKNLFAREQMALAAFEAGQASVNARTGAVHALGHSLSGLFDIPERISDAILLPHVMKANLNADVRRMAKVAEALGEHVGGLSIRAAAQRAIDAVMLLMVDVGLPTSLEKVGVDKSAISTLSERALQDPFLRTNPRALKRKDIETIYEDAFEEYVEIESAPSQSIGGPGSR